MPFPAIDPRRLRVFPLSQRRSLLRIAEEAQRARSAAEPESDAVRAQIGRLAERIVVARRKGAAVMLTYGAHLIKNGCGPLLNRLIEGGWIDHVATQGAGIIHDWEFAFQAESGESVRENAPAGTFGSWEETGRWINLAVLVGAAEGLGMGESVARMVAEDRLVIPEPRRLRAEIAANPGHPLAAAKADLLAAIETHDIPCGVLRVEHPYKQYSVLASARVGEISPLPLGEGPGVRAASAAEGPHPSPLPKGEGTTEYRHRALLTVHPGIGYDIITNHPLYHGGAIGRAAATDVRIFTASVDRLQGGVYLSVGSAIMSPQVFEKAFSAANNLRAAEGRPPLSDHYLAIVDLQDGGGWDWSRGEPSADNPAYYLRFCKSFYRMGGTLDYLRCDNRSFLVCLLRQLGIEP